MPNLNCRRNDYTSAFFLFLSMPPISTSKLNLALQMLAISAIVFCAIDCCAQDLELPKTSNDATTRRSQQESGLTLLPEYSRTNDDPIEAAESEIDLDDSQEEQRAISFESIYTGEVFNNTRGGISTNDATQYQGLLDLLMTVDLEQTRIPLPGKFAMLVQNTHGRGLTEEFIGDTQVISNIDSGDNIMQVSEYWWEFGLLDDKLTIRLGKQDLNSDFLVMDHAADFIQSSFGLSPSQGFPSYPDPSMAAVLLAQVTPTSQLKFGVWDGFANGGGWGFSGNETTYTFAELETKYSLFDDRLPGIIDLGIGYLSGGNVSGEDVSSGYGYYVQIEQLIYRENPHDDDVTQGLGVFASYFPKFANGPIQVGDIEKNYVVGLMYKGLIRGRDDDVLGLGVAEADLFQAGTGRETVVEVFYKAQLSPSISLQPDIQYIASPSGIHPDSLAIGVRFQWTPERSD